MEREHLGLIDVFTGTGKGKTTAAFGIAFRSLGWGYRVYVLQFMKMGTYGENKAALMFNDGLKVDYVGMPYFIAWEGDIPEDDIKKVENVVICKKNHPPEEYVKKVRDHYEKSLEELQSKKWDVFIYDEINVALYYHLLEVEDIMKIINIKPEHTELIFTGRKIPDVVMEKADMITEVYSPKHPYQKGILARKGIDF
ncbi:MAG: cob(I)yrinic acid a,c-diamide adenosyltransferase [Thermoplasmata archaeon]